MAISVLGGAGTATGSLTSGTPSSVTIATMPATADYKYKLWTSWQISLQLTGASSDGRGTCTIVMPQGAIRVTYSSLNNLSYRFFFGRWNSVSNSPTPSSQDATDIERALLGSSTNISTEVMASPVSAATVPIEAGPGAAVAAYVTLEHEAGGTVSAASYHLAYSYVGVKVS